MQLANCTVNLGGDPRFQVRRYGVSIPEIVVLRALHGEDAVFEFQDAGVRSKSKDGETVDEYDLLMRLYGTKEENEKTIRELFPGHNRALPQEFSDIGISADDIAPAAKKQPEVEGQPIRPPLTVKKQAS